MQIYKLSNRYLRINTLFNVLMKCVAFFIISPAICHINDCPAIWSKVYRETHLANCREAGGGGGIIKPLISYMAIRYIRQIKLALKGKTKESFENYTQLFDEGQCPSVGRLVGWSVNNEF